MPCDGTPAHIINRVINTLLAAGVLKDKPWLLFFYFSVAAGHTLLAQVCYHGCPLMISNEGNIDLLAGRYSILTRICNSGVHFPGEKMCTLKFGNYTHSSTYSRIDVAECGWKCVLRRTVSALVRVFCAEACTNYNRSNLCEHIHALPLHSPHAEASSTRPNKWPASWPVE